MILIGLEHQYRAQNGVCFVVLFSVLKPQIDLQRSLLHFREMWYCLVFTECLVIRVTWRWWFMAFILKQVEQKNPSTCGSALIYLIEKLTTFSFKSILNDEFIINYTREIWDEQKPSHIDYIEVCVFSHINSPYVYNSIVDWSLLRWNFYTFFHYID